MIASGVWLSTHPSSDLLFIHPLYGQFISQLYIWQPEIPWYALTYIFIIGVSLAVLNYSILRLRKQLEFTFIIFFATIATVLPSLWHLQFTIVAGLATAAGVLQILSYSVCEPVTKRAFIIGVLTSSCLILIGAMIRISSMLMVCAVFAPFAIVLLSHCALSTHSDKSQKLYIVKVLMVGMAVGVPVIGLQFLHHLHYRDSSEWQAWFSLNEAKKEFLDYGRIKYDEETRNIFDEVGWTQTDYDMIKTWQYVDPIQFAPEKFIYIVNSVQQDRSQKTVRADDYRRTKNGLLQILSTIKQFTASTRSGLVSLLSVIIAALLIIRWNKLSILYMGAMIW
jgi:hypothetical protein